MITVIKPKVPDSSKVVVDQTEGHAKFGRIENQGIRSVYPVNQAAHICNDTQTSDTRHPCSYQTYIDHQSDDGRYLTSPHDGARHTVGHRRDGSNGELVVQTSESHFENIRRLRTLFCQLLKRM